MNLGGGIGGLLNLRQSGNDYSYLYDGKGNVSALINGNQTVVASYAYDPFGQIMSQSGIDQPYRFSTKEIQEGTGQYYYGYRFYDSCSGKWTTRDPLGEDGGMNLYGAMLNNPVNFVDPLGLLTEVIVWQPSGWGRSSFGHVSVNINGTTYSFEPDGMRIMPSADYLAKNTFREGVGMVLNITAEQEASLGTFLKNYNKDYGRLTNNCADPIESGLEKLGYHLGAILYPVSLGKTLMDMNLVNSYNFYWASVPKKGTSAPWATK